MGSSEVSALRAGSGGVALARPVRVTFVITCLDVGGAEMMLWKLLSRIDGTRCEPSVISLSAAAPPVMLDAFRKLGVHCELLGLRPGLGAASGLHRLVPALRRLAPDLLQGWMYHGNVAASLAAAFMRPRVPVLWNVRATLMERMHEKRLTRIVIWASGRLSSLPVRIINNSLVSATEHEQRVGYSRAGRVVLPNGFDTDAFRPCREARQALRQSLGLAEDTVLVGLAARYHPMKDHGSFLRAAQGVSRAHPDAHFVLAGEGVDSSNPELAACVAAYGLGGRVHLLGIRHDMHAVFAGLDVVASASSSGEGFPNVIGEAMSCGVPCVVTDVGESALVVGDTGVVVPPRDAEALALAISRLIASGAAYRARMGTSARQRVLEKYSLESIVRQYEDLYVQVHRERNGLRST